MIEKNTYQSAGPDGSGVIGIDFHYTESFRIAKNTNSKESPLGEVSILRIRGMQDSVIDHMMQNGPVTTEDVRVWFRFAEVETEAALAIWDLVEHGVIEFLGDLKTSLQLTSLQTV